MNVNSYFAVPPLAADRYLLIFMALLNYLVDAYKIFAASGVSIHLKFFIFVADKSPGVQLSALLALRYESPLLALWQCDGLDGLMIIQYRVGCLRVLTSI